MEAQASFRKVLSAIALASLCACASAHAETRGYVISLIHTATYSNEGNCPDGGNGGVVDLKMRVLQNMGYSKEEAARILANNGINDKGERIDVRKRGKVDGKPVDVQAFPTSVPDPQIETVRGRLAYGFNLDGKIQPDSFEEPETGEKGIDNQMWRVLGCFEVYDVRRPVIPYSEGIAWDTSLDAMPAWLMSVTGEDLDKDGPVTVRFDRSLNVAMRDARSGVLYGSSYTIDPDPRSQSEFKGQIKNGVLTIEPGNFSMQGESQFQAWLRLSHTQLRLKLRPDGSVAGLLGGYQPWLDYYHFLAIRGEESGQVDVPGVYYALKRHADGDPDPVTGENRGISTAYYIEAVPAFLTTTDRQVVARAHVTDEPPIQQQAVLHAESPPSASP
jgi:hypothetical protein